MLVLCATAKKIRELVASRGCGNVTRERVQVLRGFPPRHRDQDVAVAIRGAYLGAEASLRLAGPLGDRLHLREQIVSLSRNRSIPGHVKNNGMLFHELSLGPAQVGAGYLGSAECRAAAIACSCARVGGVVYDCGKVSPKPSPE